MTERPVNDLPEERVEEREAQRRRRLGLTGLGILALGTVCLLGGVMLGDVTGDRREAERIADTATAYAAEIGVQLADCESQKAGAQMLLTQLAMLTPVPREVTREATVVVTATMDPGVVCFEVSTPTPLPTLTPTHLPAPTRLPTIVATLPVPPPSEPPRPTDTAVPPPTHEPTSTEVPPQTTRVPTITSNP